MKTKNTLCFAIFVLTSTVTALFGRRALKDEFTFNSLDGQWDLKGHDAAQRYHYDVVRPTRDTPLDLSRTRGDSLDAFALELRSYLNLTRFNNDRFAASIPRLRSRLEEIRIEMAHFTEYNDELMSRFRWAIQFFEVLQVTDRNMRLAYHCTDPFHRLLYETSELRAIIMGMFDINGRPDHSMANFSFLVSRLSMRRQAMERNFGNFTSIPFTLRAMIWDHLMRAAESLRALEVPVVHLPPPNAPCGSKTS